MKHTVEMQRPGLGRWLRHAALAGDALRSWGAKLLRQTQDSNRLQRQVDTFPLVDEAELPEDVGAHPGMISPEERRLLYGLARNFYKGKGAIVDAGVFLGASTTAFGRGLRDNPDIDVSALTEKPIRSFERGIAGPNFARHARRAGLPEVPVGDSFEALLRAQIEPMQDLVDLNIGDILEYTGDDIKGIEICFLDILKTPDVTRHAMRVFLPRLVPGAIIIQQDYFFSDLPYIKVYNEALSEKLRYLGEVRSSAVFEAMEPISQSDLDDAFAAAESLDRSVPLHRRAEARTINPARQYLMRLSRSLLYALAHNSKMAEQTLADANRAFPDIARSRFSLVQPHAAWRRERLQKAIELARVVEARRADREERLARRQAERDSRSLNRG